MSRRPSYSLLFFLFPPDGNTGANAGRHADKEEYPPYAAALRSRFRGLGSGLRGGFGLRRGRGRGILLDLQSRDRFGLRVFAQLTDALLLPFLAGGQPRG